jgi:Lysophospholipase L1 and related esterases
MQKHSLFPLMAVVLLLTACKQQPLNFGCDGDSITAGDQWSVTVAADLCCATHHNAGVGTATWASHDDTQEYGCEDFAGISFWWLPTTDSLELRRRHNNCAEVHVQKFIAEVESGEYPEPDLFGFAMGTNDGDIDRMEEGARRSIRLVQERFPKCKVFVCTPIQTGSAEKNAENRAKIERLNAVCAELRVPVIDCYNGVPIREEEEVWMGQGKYLRDGLHPDKPGQELMGHYIASEVKRISN